MMPIHLITINKITRPKQLSPGSNLSEWTSKVDTIIENKHKSKSIT